MFGQATFVLFFPKDESLNNLVKIYIYIRHVFKYVNVKGVLTLQEDYLTIHLPLYPLTHFDDKNYFRKVFLYYATSM